MQNANQVPGPQFTFQYQQALNQNTQFSAQPSMSRPGYPTMGAPTQGKGGTMGPMMGQGGKGRMPMSQPGNGEKGSIMGQSGKGGQMGKGQMRSQGGKGQMGMQGGKGQRGMQGGKGQRGMQGGKGQMGMQGGKGRPGTMNRAQPYARQPNSMVRRNIANLENNFEQKRMEELVDPRKTPVHLSHMVTSNRRRAVEAADAAPATSPAASAAAEEEPPKNSRGFCGSRASGSVMGSPMQYDLDYVSNCTSYGKGCGCGTRGCGGNCGWSCGGCGQSSCGGGCFASASYAAISSFRPDCTVPAFGPSGYLGAINAYGSGCSSYTGYACGCGLVGCAGTCGFWGGGGCGCGMSSCGGGCGYNTSGCGCGISSCGGGCGYNSWACGCGISSCNGGCGYSYYSSSWSNWGAACGCGISSCTGGCGYGSCGMGGGCGCGMSACGGNCGWIGDGCTRCLQVNCICGRYSAGVADCLSLDSGCGPVVVPPCMRCGVFGPCECGRPFIFGDFVGNDIYQRKKMSKCNLREPRKLSELGSSMTVRNPPEEDEQDVVVIERAIKPNREKKSVVKQILLK
jgi:hypothetical protein